MAKAKKPVAGKSETSKSEAKGEIAKKPAAKKATPTSAAASPAFSVDTNLAAESAARLLAARGATRPPTDPLARPESSMFKQLKSGLNKPAGQTMSGLLDKHGGPDQKKSGTPFGQQQQIGRNQTFGADVNRSGVPRRTGGG